MLKACVAFYERANPSDDWALGIVDFYRLPTFNRFRVFHTYDRLRPNSQVS
jgi:hypothetical protein